jgi:hypothetical protein
MSPTICLFKPAMGILCGGGGVAFGFAEGAVGILGCGGWEVADGLGDDEEVPEAFFAACCRSSVRILDELGSTFGCALGAAGFVSAFGDSAFGGAEAGEEDFGVAFLAVAGFAGAACTGLLAGEAFDALVVALVVFGPALVDFALVVTFFAPSGTSTSTGSVMTFFGLPLFLATSVDILRGELDVLKI